MIEPQECERNFELLERRNEELRALVEIGKALTSSLDLQEILNVIMEKVSLLLKPHTWSLLLVDEGSGELVYEIAVSPSAERLKGVRLSRGEGIAGWVSVQGEPQLIPDISGDEHVTPLPEYRIHPPARSVLCVPVKSKNRTLGVMELVNTVEERVFDEADLKILSTIADYAAIAIENAYYFKKVNELAITDDLTGLYNSRHFHYLLDYEVERASRYDADLSLVFIDLDYFKKINDSYGHLVGSRLLTEVGHIIIRHIRKVDIAARYGGDEFVIVLPNVPKGGAYSMAAKMRRVFNAHDFLAEEGYRINLTASFGIASFPEDARSKIDLISLADKAMYEVKASTRDGIKMY